MIETPNVFISYARKDQFFVDRLREDLKRSNVHYWIDHEGLSAGTASWEKAIRAALQNCDSVLWVVSPSSFESAYVRDEISIARMDKRNIYPIFAAGENWLKCVPLGTGEIQYIDARTDYNAALNTILEALGAATSTYKMPEDEKPTLPEGAEPRNPYKGLLAFTEKDTSDFFGREALVAKLKNRLEQKIADSADRFLAVLGASGAGKSSVVMAGLLPALNQAHDDWLVLPKMVPGTHPVEALADALYSAMPDKSLSAIEQDLNSTGGRMLHRLVRQIDAQQVVLYVDQFEELFTLTADEAERQQFIDLITQAATEPDGKLIIILTMRADFYGHPANYPELGKLVNLNSELVLPMSISELRDAIEKPARFPDVALTFDNGLVAEIIFALRERDKALAGALPLLQFTLERLFEAREGTHLTWEAYNALGKPEQGISGVEGAIGTHCEAVFQTLPEEAQDKLGQVFLPLVNIDETTGEATRRRAVLDKVKNGETAIFIDRFVNNRLLQTGVEMVLGNDVARKVTYLEITHEALFRSWERLVAWIATTRDDLRLLRQVEREAIDWDTAGRSYRLTAARLTPIYDAIERLDYALSPVMDDFVHPQDALVKILDNRETTEQERMQIGIELAELGDTRKGVGVKMFPSPSEALGRGARGEGKILLPDMLWLPVTGSDGKYPFKDRKGEVFGEFEVPDFFISKYLTTYQQYQAFVDAEDGYQNKEWWHDFPTEYQPQELEEQRTKSSNNPRDSISWYQSVAFGRWMTAQCHGLELEHPSGKTICVGEGEGLEGYQIRNPTDWEWQWAAMNGDEARVYPWGEWQSGYAITSESGLGRAIAVGLYPHGAALCEALDMAGNLWEWCANDYHYSDIIDAQNKNSKALRGGAFYYNQSNARSSYRILHSPRRVNSHYGVRLVVAPMGL